VKCKLNNIVVFAQLLSGVYVALPI